VLTSPFCPFYRKMSVIFALGQTLFITPTTDNQFTGGHCDATMNRKNNSGPKKGNSQVPGTPVVIVSFGDPKLLLLNEYWYNPTGGKMSKGAEEVCHPPSYRPDHVLRQDSYSVFMLDPRDEEGIKPTPAEPATWIKHSSRLVRKSDCKTVAHSSHMTEEQCRQLLEPCQSDHAQISWAYRVVQEKREVFVDTNRLVQPHSAGPSKGPAIKKARNKLEKNPAAMAINIAKTERCRLRLRKHVNMPKQTKKKKN